jgi:hypothetical protein
MSAKSAVSNRRPAGRSDGSDNLSAIIAADRAFPAAIAELVRPPRKMKKLSLLALFTSSVLSAYSEGVFLSTGDSWTYGFTNLEYLRTTTGSHTKLPTEQT